MLRKSGRLILATKKKWNIIGSPETTHKLHQGMTTVFKFPWSRVTLKYGELLEEEQPRHNAIAVMKASYCRSNNARSIEFVRDLYHERYSLWFQAGHDSLMIDCIAPMEVDAR